MPEALAVADAEPVRVALSLISHTNAGKTTLARTLLRRAVGEVRDEPHVTEFSEEHLLARSAAGDELRLWDTPGFGDTVRLVQRLQREGTALGWFLAEVWDRWRDRAFWANQQALRHVREQTDVVLYLVNAAESTQAAAYVDSEMQLLAWMKRPVIVLLNQLGAQRSPEDEARDIARWRSHLQAWPGVAQVLPMDAFARCWVQEGTLLAAVQAVLPVERQAGMARLRQAWQGEQLAVFEQAVGALARSLARVGDTRMRLDSQGRLTDAWRDVTARLGAKLGGGPAPADAAAQAQARLVVALDDEVNAGTAELIRLHGLHGRAQGEILARVAQQIEVNARIDEGHAAIWGGVLSGALAGLKADLATGGLTMGGGLLAGGLLGALGAAGLARGVNVMRGGGPPWVGWSAQAMLPITEAALLRYLAVAHFGRGRGEWAQGEAPPHWRAQVAEVLQTVQPALAAVWASRAGALDAPPQADQLEAMLRPQLDAVLRQVLVRLYPEARELMEKSPGVAQSQP